MNSPSQDRINVLIVEDNPGDVFLIRAAVNKVWPHCQIHVADDGDIALRFIDRATNDPDAPCPDFMMLDLNLPKHSGDQVLRRLRDSWRCGGAAVVVVTSSDSPADRANMLNLGATAYFRKPSDVDEFMKLADVVRDVAAHRPTEQLP